MLHTEHPKLSVSKLYLMTVAEMGTRGKYRSSILFSLELGSLQSWLLEKQLSKVEEPIEAWAATCSRRPAIIPLEESTLFISIFWKLTVITSASFKSVAC